MPWQRFLTMRLMSKSLLTILFAMALAAPAGWSSAFSIAELGARAAGMGTAFAAVADDASALFYNPAGISFLPGPTFQMDNLVVVGMFHFIPLNPPVGQVVPEKGFNGSIRPKFIPVGSLYMAFPISDRISFGFGGFAPFGLSDNFTNFNDTDPPLTKFPGRFAGTRARLESFWLQPTISIRLSESHAIGIGPALVYTHIFLEQSILNPLDDGLEFGREAADDIFPGIPKEQAARSIARLLPEGRARLAGTAKSPGLAAGYLYHPPNGFGFGLTYRSAVAHHLDGDASFAFNKGYTLEQFVGSDLLDKAFPNQKIKGLFITPATYSVGLSKRFGGTVLAVEGRFQDYRRFSSVPLNFTITEADDEDVRTPAENRLIFDFKDSYHLAAGIETSKGSMSLRAGYLFDRSPVVEKSVGPLFPDANRHSGTVGMSMRKGNKEFTFFYEAMQFLNRHTNVAGNDNIGTNGEYRNFAHLAGTSLRITFGQ